MTASRSQLRVISSSQVTRANADPSSRWSTCTDTGAFVTSSADQRRWKSCDRSLRASTDSGVNDGAQSAVWSTRGNVIRGTERRFQPPGPQLSPQLLNRGLGHRVGLPDPALSDWLITGHRFPAANRPPPVDDQILWFRALVLRQRASGGKTATGWHSGRVVFHHGELERLGWPREIAR